MLCEVCGKAKAVVVIRFLLEGKENTVHACRKCSAQVMAVGLEALSGTSAEGARPKVEEQEYCPRCKALLTLGEAGQLPVLGCPDCYDYLPEATRKRLAECQGAVRHLPIELVASEAGGELASLLLEYQLAITQEDYERAEELRVRLEQEKPVEDGDNR